MYGTLRGFRASAWAAAAKPPAPTFLPRLSEAWDRGLSPGVDWPRKMSVIAEILRASASRLRERMSKRPLAEVKAAAAGAPKCATSFRAELESARFSVIAE